MNLEIELISPDKNARCKYDGKTYMVLAGSTIIKDTGKNCPDSIAYLRNDSEIIDKEEGILSCDVIFSSSSDAATFVSGTKKSGEIFWFDTKTNRLLKEILNENKAD